MTPEEDAHYTATSLQPHSAGYMLPVVPNIAEYYKTSASREVVKMAK